MYDDEGLSFCVELTVLDGFWLAGLDVAHVLIGDVCGAQGELGQDVGVIRHPLRGGWQRSSRGRAVHCFNDTKGHSVENVIRLLLWRHRNPKKKPQGAGSGAVRVSVRNIQDSQHP